MFENPGGPNRHMMATRKMTSLITNLLFIWIIAGFENDGKQPKAMCEIQT